MTSEPMTRLAESEADSEEAAFVGRVSFAGGDAWCTVTHADLARAAQFAADMLVALGLRPGDVICFVSRHSEAVQFAPIELAAQRMGLISCHVEATRFDAHRLTLYFTHLPVRALIGLTGEVMDNLGVELRQILLPDTIVAAFEPLAGRLRESGIDALAMEVIGPSLALECAASQGLHLDESIWTFREHGGQIFGAPAAVSSESGVDIGVEGTLVYVECGCGMTGPRLCR